MKNDFIIDYTDRSGYQDHLKNCFITDYADIQLDVKNNFIIDYTQYTLLWKATIDDIFINDYGNIQE